MKLPRWLMIGLWTSIVLSVLAVAGWWWVTWPERTAREFLILIQDGRWNEAGKMYSADTELDGPRDKDEKEFARSLRLEMVHPRKWPDVARARQGFRLLKPDGKEHSVLRAQKGRILEGDWRDSKENRQIE